MADDLLRENLLEEAASVERHMSISDVHIGEQRRRIVWQDTTGRDSVRSRELLQTFLGIQASRIAHHDRLVRKLGELTGLTREWADLRQQ